MNHGFGSDSQLSVTNTIYMRESAKMSILLNINLNSSKTFALRAAVATAWIEKPTLNQH